MFPCLSESALLFGLNLAKKPVKYSRLCIHLLWNYYIYVSTHVHFYREQRAVSLIQRVLHSKNILGAETMSALLQMHRSWNALPDRSRV